MTDVEEIKSRLDVADVVQEYLPLKPAGSGSFKGLCPFHHEKTPSFFVNRPRQSWHCFGCDEGGDILSFVMKMEGLEFREALELLAQKCGVILQAVPQADRTERQRLYEVNDLAARFFRATLLQSTTAEGARAYVKQRGLEDLTGDVWRIGYAPGEWRTLVTALTGRGVSEEDLIKAGLAIRAEKGNIYDRFRDRIMFTICDVNGHVVGFTGRVLDPDSKEAKYVNTPETLVYKKNAILFGLDKAKGEIRSQDLAVIVEGNMDVVSSHQAGIRHVVASSGTALTSEQIRLIKRFTSHVAIAFDQDSAGRAATIRGLDVARHMEMDVKIITLPPEAGKDPDEAVRKDPELWKEAIRSSVAIMEWLYRQAFRGRDARTPDGKKDIAKLLLPEMKRIADVVEREGWLTRLANDLDVRLSILEQALTRVPSVVGQRPSPIGDRASSVPAPLREILTRQQQLEERLIAIVQCCPDTRPLVEKALGRYTPALDVPSERLAYFSMLADREFSDQSLSALQPEMINTARTYFEDRILLERQRLEQEMREAERIGDSARIDDLLHQVEDLNHFSLSL